jgi:cell division protein FtsZ
MIETGIEGVEFISANTDVQALKQSYAPMKLQLGEKLTKGLGVGSDPELGKQAALEDTEKIIDLLEGADMVFITAGLGGGTGTGGSPIVASLAAELGALTVAVVTTPFQFEGKKRMLQATAGLEDLKDGADTVITIPNEKLLSTVPAGTSLFEAFKFADDVLRQAVQGISDLITIPGVINLDFADVKTIMSGMGMALMGTGLAEGDDRATTAAHNAICSPLLEDTSIEGARGVLINVTGNQNMTLQEVSDASRIVQEAAHPDAHIIFGSVFDDRMGDQLKITVIATGFENQHAMATRRAERESWRQPIHAVAGGSGTEDEFFESQPVEPQLEDSQGETDILDIPAFLRHQVEG